MNIIYKCEIIDYEYINNKKKNTILFLHGWGGDKNSFNLIKKFLNCGYNLLSITLPTSEKTFSVWTLFDYFKLTETILNLHNINDCVIICHSFGFRIACLLNNRITMKRIVVTGGAGLIKHSVIKKIEQQNKLIAIKKDATMFNKFASEDYKLLPATNKKNF